MPVLLPIASGKGGVGKSVVAANLAFQLAKLGKTVILADMDWGGSNAHTILGLKNNQPGVGAFVADKTLRLDALVQPQPEPHFFFLPGDGLIPGTANMSYFRKVKLIKELRGLAADYVVLDLGAGTHYNTIDVFLACGAGFIATTPEPTAILNAYSFLKTALYRLLHAALPSSHPGRAIVHAHFAARRDLGAESGDGLDSLFAALEREDAAAAERLRRLHAAFCPRVIVNMGKEVQELALGGRLRAVCRKHLSMEIEYIAFFPWDDEVRRSVIERTLISRSAPGSPFVKATAAVARRLAVAKLDQVPPPIEDFADMRALAEEAEHEGFA